jgi:hypothetical protein
MIRLSFWKPAVDIVMAVDEKPGGGIKSKTTPDLRHALSRAPLKMLIE